MTGRIYRVWGNFLNHELQFTKRTMEKRGGKGLGRLYRAFGWSMAGLKATFAHEAAFRQELLLCVILTPLAFYFGKTGVEKTLLLGSLILVLIVELLNSAIEAAVDRIGEDEHELAGRAKDMGSAAVFLSLVNVGVIWLLVILA
jgi:diacylglycerol kinase (ATP)